jgi:hypothetical protein
MRKSRRDRLQSHIWLTASSYMSKYWRILIYYCRKPFLIYDFASCNRSHLIFLTHKENFILFFISARSGNWWILCTNIKLLKLLICSRVSFPPIKVKTISRYCPFNLLIFFRVSFPPVKVLLLSCCSVFLAWLLTVGVEEPARGILRCRTLRATRPPLARPARAPGR